MASVQTNGHRPIGQPDIAYAPDYNKYLKRTQHRKTTEKLADSLPQGFPKELKSDLVWQGDNIGDDFDWTYVLTDENLEEIEKALSHFKGTERHLSTSFFLTTCQHLGNRSDSSTRRLSRSQT